jgi:serine/threonine protein kinase/WD40 repeat protein
MEVRPGMALQGIGVSMTPDVEPGNIDETPGTGMRALAGDRIKDLFADASELPAEQREALLRERCGGDVKLRQAVEALLAAHEQAGRFLASTTRQMQSDDAPLGQLIGRYKLLQKIGEGGFGTVYMAEQEHPVRRRVALKIIKAGMDSRQIISRFEAERQALAMMDHPNIARVLDAGATDSGRPYFVMELVDGVPITRYCDEQQLNPRERLELFIAICNGLQHAHQKGIIHRDIKPSNILVITYDGKPVPKIIDFGIAKALHQKLTEGTLYTQFGAAVGTLEYMSPEQTQRDAAGTDTRSDIYSLGVVLYELLVGSTPLESTTLRNADYAEVLRLIREAEPPRPSARIGDSGMALAAISAHRKVDSRDLEKLVSGDLDWIVMKALEKDRTRRYATASDLARDIQRYLADEPVEARPPSARYRFGKFARKHRAALRAAVAALVLLLGATAFSAWQAIRATRAGNATREQLRLTTEAENQAMHRLFDARLAQAKAAHHSRRVGQRLDSLDALAEASQIARQLKLPEDSFGELRNVAIACLALPDLRLAKQWPGAPPGSDHYDFDGNLEFYARTDKQGAVSIRRVAGDVEIGRLPGSGFETGVLISSDGRFLAVWSTNLDVWKLGEGEPVAVLHRTTGNFLGFDFSPDGREFVIGDAGGSITLYDLKTERAPRQLPGGGRALRVAFHPGKPWVAVAHDTGVEIRDLDTGNVVAALQTLIGGDSLAWNPDGKTLGLGCYDRMIYLWNMESGAPPLILEGINNGGIRIAFNHAGNLLASTGWEGQLRLWDTRTGKQLFVAQNSLGIIPRFSHDDRMLAGYGRDGTLGLWEVAASGGEYRTLLHHPKEGKAFYQCPAIDNGASLLAVGMDDGVCFWDLNDGAEVAFIHLPGCHDVLFDSTGALLTNGAADLLRWPIRKDGMDSVQIGPPARLSVPGPISRFASNGDGRVIATAQFQGGSVWHSDRPDTPVRLQPHDDARYVAVSHDGQWVATGSHTRMRVKVWDALSGRLETDLPADLSDVEFSPDGKWLGTTGSALRLWSTESWKLERTIGGIHSAFSPDSRMLALETGDGVLRLVDPETGREYARLEDPSQDRAGFIRFSADGTQLVATNNDSHSVHVWDLRKIRRELAQRGLDWDLPAYGPSNEGRAKPIRVRVDLGDLEGMLKGHP